MAKSTYQTRRQQLMKQRRDATAAAIEKKKEENKKRQEKLGGLSPSQYNKGKDYGSNKDNKPKSVKITGNFVTKNGKRYLKTSPMGKRIVADQKRKSLASKNYMSKEMIEKRKKRLKIKK